ncbi:MAG: GIY-YIG nuclease family protein [Phycisphaerales bacterium]|nr:GIY-YIG nuclease family protein [Phycisphaerales bacterium]
MKTRTSARDRAARCDATAESSADRQTSGAAGWCVYIVRCADGTLYTGIAKNLDRRIAQHNAGTASRYTRSRRPVQAAWSEPQPSQSAALKREAAIKTMTRRQKDALLSAGSRAPMRRARPAPPA